MSYCDVISHALQSFVVAPKLTKHMILHKTIVDKSISNCTNDKSLCQFMQMLQKNESETIL
jgi:hypothetical protein